MKYILIIFLFSCSQPSGRIIISEDSTGITSGPATLKIQPSYDSGFTGISFLPLRITDDGSYILWHEDGKITIKGDTVKVIRHLLESMKRAQETEHKLYKENHELRKVIQQLIKEQNEIQHIRVTTDL